MLFDFFASLLKHVRTTEIRESAVPLPTPSLWAAHLQLPLATFLLIFNVSFATFGSNLPACPSPYTSGNPHKTQLFAQLTTQFGSSTAPLLHLCLCPSLPSSLCSPQHVPNIFVALPWPDLPPLLPLNSACKLTPSPPPPPALLEVH